MNKNQYAAILDRQLRRKNDLEVSKVRKAKSYSAMNKKKVALQKQNDEIYNKIMDLNKRMKGLEDKALDKLGLTYPKRKNLVTEFNAEWVEVALIFDPKKRKVAGEKLLKKYDLYR